MKNEFQPFGPKDWAATAAFVIVGLLVCWGVWEFSRQMGIV